MKAIVVRGAGGGEALRLEQVPDPTPADNEVVIAVAGCGVCFHDILVRNGVLRASVELPCIPGHEIAGTIVAAGRSVRRLKVGERVATTQRHGTCGVCRSCRAGLEPLCVESKLLGDHGLRGGYADFVAVAEDCVVRVPDGIALEDASIVACTIGTIFNAAREVAHLQAGETVLVTGAGGGLGLHAVQVARLAGARVIAVTSSEDKTEAIRGAGAERVIAFHRGVDFSAEVREATDGRGVDVAIDNVGSPTFEAVRRSMATRGRWVLIGQLSGEAVSVNLGYLIYKGISLLPARGTTRAQLEDCLDLVARNKLRPIIGATLPLERAAAAHQLVESGGVVGRVVLKPGG
jgi:D-arabinose 1-dehydrogenase-like Zn-dependent alcohol dehydrogenase